MSDKESDASARETGSEGEESVVSEGEGEGGVSGVREKGKKKGRKPAKPKLSCLKCGLSANSSKKSKGSLQCCGPCKLWCHYECSRLELVEFNLITKMIKKGSGKWVCWVCEAGLEKVDTMLKGLGVKVNEILVEQKAQAESVKQINTRMDTKDLEMVQMKEEIAKLKGNSNQTVFKELRERTTREKNLLMHRCPESTSSSVRNKRDYDMTGIQEL